MTALVETIAHGAIRELKLARPPANALNPELCRALVAAIAQAHDDGVRGLVLSGGERIFTAGLDVPHLLSLGADKAALHDAWQAFFAAARAVAESRIPLVTAITGHSPAGGCVIALCADRRVMARSVDAAKPYVIGLNEVQVGLVAPEGIQRLMRRAVGAHRAAQLLMQGELVPAEHALQIGLVDELADAEDVVPHAVAWLQKLLALPQRQMQETRAIARAEVVEALADQHINLARFVDGWASPDTQAALQAMVARLRK